MFADMPDDWFRTEAGKNVVNNVLTWQNANGGWFKNYNPTKPRPPVVVDEPDNAAPGDGPEVWHQVSTIDNDATYTELRVLARAQRVLNRDDYRSAFLRGVEYLLKAQYPNGGWPQRFPLQNNYGRHITFNDDAMTEVCRLMRDVGERDQDFRFVNENLRARCDAAYRRGIDCILQCQIVQKGVLTAWAQQHDEVTLKPAGGRTYELPAISGRESEDIVRLLMEIEKPDDRAKRAIAAAAAWYERSKITGKRLQVFRGPQYENGWDTQLIDDPSAPPIWARFYDVETNQPFFASRDGHRHDRLADVPWERRNLYSWFGQWGKHVAGEYADWKKRITARP
jgi:PelA/Pel-15E family pectate lyase